MKPKHHFSIKAASFLDTIGMKRPNRANEWDMAYFWMANQENIVIAIRDFCGSKPRIYAGYIRIFGILSQSAKYLTEFKATQPCKP